MLTLEQKRVARNLLVFSLVAFIICATRPLFGKVEHHGLTSTSTKTSPPLKASSTPITSTSPTARTKHDTSRSTPHVTHAGNNDYTPLHGVDVSHYQGDIHWPTVFKHSVDFVFIKATEGIQYVDPKFHTNKTAIHAHNKPLGTYHFFNPNISARLQAEHFLSTTGTNHQLPPVIDIEVTAGQHTDIIIKGVQQWITIVQEKTQCTPLIYTDISFWRTHLAKHFKTHPVWIAEYASKLHLLEGEPLNWIFWQHSQSGEIPGISGAVDLNTGSKELPGISSILCKV